MFNIWRDQVANERSEIFEISDSVGRWKETFDIEPILGLFLFFSLKKQDEAVCMDVNRSFVYQASFINFVFVLFYNNTDYKETGY